MAQDPKIRSTVRPPARPEAIASTLQTKLEDEAYVLESLVAGLSRDKAPPELWALLHQAAARDERIPDLAFAYERLLQDRKFKYLTSALQVEILMYAATFFADVFGDLDGATGLLDQVLAHNPSHPEAFAKMEAVLAASGNGMKLADVYAAQAFHRQDKDEQLALLSRAAELADGFADEHERAIKIYQALLRVEPTNERARSSLEARLGQAGKFRELARLLEQSLTSAPEPSLETATGIRERLIALYVGELGEPERALPHSEEILRQNPAHELGRRTAHRLVSHKPLAGRAAGALADAYEELGTFPEAAAMLEVSLESLRGSKRTEGQKRLGILKQDKLGDQAGAHPLFEAVVALDPGDDEVRRRYIDLSKQLGKQLEAARLLSRAATGVKETALKARLGTEVGEIYLAGNDTKRARSAFASVVDTARSDDPAVLPAARALAGLYADGKEQKPLAQMLELLSRIEPHETARSAAAERLGQVAEDLDDKARAISAYRSLLGSPLHEQALEGLERLYAATEAYAELVDVLEKRADLQTNASTARALALRAAELRTAHTKDRARAISAWMDFLGIYGSSRDVHAKVVPLLEQEKKWDKLATILAEDLVLAPEPERIPILLKLAQVRLARLEDAAGAIDAYRQVWAIDSKEPTMRQALEKLLGSPDVRLSAASLLEPAYRSEGAAPQLVRVLEVRADSAPTPELRLALFDEATEIALRDLRDPERALELAGRALHEAPFEAPLLGARLEAIDRIAEGAGDAARLAAILSSALGDRPIDSAALLDLAKRTGQALVSAGDRSGALSVFRRALAFEPSSRDLLGRIDGLLAEEGRPEERIVLYRAALREAHLPERRRELYHAIATIERRDLADTAAAIATWRQALAENPADRAAHGALLDAYEIAGDWAALYEELGRTLEGEGGEARAAIVLKMGEVAAKRGDDARALAHFSELFLAGSGKDELLSAMANLAERTGDLDTLEEVLRRRVALSSEAQEECAWLDRLGEMQAERRGDNASGAASWKRAGRVALEALLDDERARALFEKALRAAPADLEAALHLFKLYLQGEIWDKITAVAKVVVEQAADADLAAQRLLEFEPHVHKSGGVATWLSLADGLTATSKRADIAFARARVLASVPSRQREAAATLRELVLARMGDGRAVEAFDAFLAKVDPAEHRDDRRFLLEWKAEHAPEAQRMSALFTWAAAEEASFGDLHAAVAVYRRILAIEPERAPALEATARLLRQLGDAEGALHALTLLRDSSEGASRRERDLEIAELLLTELGRPEEALARVSPLIEAGTADADALGIVYRTIEYPEARENAAGLLERAALGAEDDQQALHILKTLLGMPRAPALEGARRRWFESLLDKYEGEPSVALETALVAVAEVPEDESLWERAEKLARLLEEPAKIAAAYRRVLELPLAGELAASLGRRAVDYQEEWFDDQPTVIALLRSVLAKAPEANWARDRLKLAYGSAERWDDLFALYDEAVLRAETDEQRADLLAEAAEAAKDFAADADRAIGYFERLLALRPRDPRVPVVLERLYEKQGRILPLIDLLTSELAALSGEKAQQLRVRI
ncbi:MAG TPA: hypothetical protein VJT73_16985, partial [Polyangiaceae bacterium]|nr:hypothetical protein [Polyangiaceae bacterium]